MKQTYLLKYLCVVLLFFTISSPLQAQNFKLIDVNKSKNSNPDNYQNASKNMFAELNGIFYFAADDGIHGTELFRSNGKAEGTELVKDINPGTAPSYPYNITVSGDKIYILASDTLSNNQKLFVSDGTNDGTRLLHYSGPGILPYIQNLTEVNGSLYFIYSYYDSTFNSYQQLWKTNGMDSGTVMVTDLNGYAQQLVNVNGVLFYTQYDRTSNGGALYKSNGTAEGTTLVSDINPNSQNMPSNLTVLNGVLYFAADTGTGNELWMSDGTAKGTHPVKNTNHIYLPMRFSDLVDPFTVTKNALFFQGYVFDSATSTGSGYELCTYNPANINNNVSMVKDIIPGKKSSYPSNITDVNGTVFFTIGPDSADAELWKSDGTKDGTVLVKDISPGGKNLYASLTNANGTLVFAYGNEELGTELWKSNGTGSGTVLIKDIKPGASGSDPGVFTYKNGIFLFKADGPDGNELWSTNTTAESTVMVKDINNTSSSSSSPAGFTSIANKRVLFSANNEKQPFSSYSYPFSLYTTDGSDAGTTPVGSSASVAPSLGQSSISRLKFTGFKNEYYFSDDFNHIWKTNCTKSGTTILPIPDLVNSGYIDNLVATDNLLYIFVLNYETSHTVLWRTDGTFMGTFILKSDLSLDYLKYPVAVGNTLFFSSFDPERLSGQLWKTDGSVSGTRVVKITGNSSDYPTPPANLYNFNGKLYFLASSATGTNFSSSIWTSNGTEAGTTILKDGPVSFASFAGSPFAEAKGKLFFLAHDSQNDQDALFLTDSAASSTSVVKHLNKDSTNYPSLISGDTALYFLNYGLTGPEVWKSDGTNKGTIKVKNITPNLYAYFENTVNVNDKLFFTINDTLWQSDGTEQNTRPAEDENLRGVTKITNLTAIGDSLYFSGYTYGSGQELYIGNAKIGKAPNVAVSTPDRTFRFIAPANIKLHAEATDKDGTITKVEFYNGTTLLHTETLAPYGFVWRNVPLGNYTITAKAYDNSGNVTTSNSIGLSVVPNKPPTVSIVKPKNNQAFAAPGYIHLEANAKDIDGRITRVDFYNGSTLLRTEFKAPYTYVWKNVPRGTYSITAVATDNWGAQTKSAPVTIKVVLPPATIASNKPLPGKPTLDIESSASLTLHPNPARNTVNIVIKGLQPYKQAQLSVLSVAGIVIKTMEINSHTETLQMDVSLLPRGVYTIRVASREKVMYKKFVKL